MGMQGTKLLMVQRRQIRRVWHPAAVTAIATVSHEAEEHRPLARLKAGDLGIQSCDMRLHHHPITVTNTWGCHACSRAALA